jgi:hypothetical protein
VACLADEILDRVLDMELPLKNFATNGLNVELIEGVLEELAGDTKLLVQLIRKIENDLGAEVQQIPSLEILEECLLGCMKASSGVEFVADELKFSTSQCKAETERVKLEVSCYPC